MNKSGWAHYGTAPQTGDEMAEGDETRRHHSPAFLRRPPVIRNNEAKEQSLGCSGAIFTILYIPFEILMTELQLLTVYYI